MSQGWSLSAVGLDTLKSSWLPFDLAPAGMNNSVVRFHAGARRAYSCQACRLRSGRVVPWRCSCCRPLRSLMIVNADSRPRSAADDARFHSPGSATASCPPNRAPGAPSSRRRTSCAAMTLRTPLSHAAHVGDQAVHDVWRTAMSMIPLPRWLSASASVPSVRTDDQFARRAPSWRHRSDAQIATTLIDCSRPEKYSACNCRDPVVACTIAAIDDRRYLLRELILTHAHCRHDQSGCGRQRCRRDQPLSRINLLQPRWR